MSKYHKNPIDRMSPAELVSMVGGISEVKAIDLLNRIGGLVGIMRSGVGELANIVGDVPALRIHAALELSRRIFEEAAKPLFKVYDSESAYEWAKPRIAHLDHEELWILCLDGRNYVKSARMVVKGGLSGVDLGIRDVLRIGLREGSNAIVIIHNHPSNDPTPSDEDVIFTRDLQHAAKNIGTPLVDHVVVARSRYVSMLERGIIK